MSPEITRKSPTETKVFTMNFGRALNPGATISNVVSVTGQPAGLNISNATVLPSGQAVSVSIGGGVAQSNYEVTFKVSTSDGEDPEETGRLQVRLPRT